MLSPVPKGDRGHPHLDLDRSPGPGPPAAVVHASGDGREARIPGKLRWLASHQHLLSSLLEVHTKGTLDPA